MKTFRLPYWYLLVIPLFFIFVGASTNQMVLFANWGKFPVMVNERMREKMQKQDCNPVDIWIGFAAPKKFSILDTAVSSSKHSCPPSEFLDDIHSVMGHNSRLKFLADYINLQTEICSPGDLIIDLGTWLFYFSSIMWLGLALRLVIISQNEKHTFSSSSSRRDGSQ